MDNDTVVKMLSGTVVRGVMWMLGLLCGYLTAKGIQAPAVDQAVVTNLVTGALTVALPVLASWWSSRKDKALLMTKPPKG